MKMDDVVGDSLLFKIEKEEHESSDVRIAEESVPRLDMDNRGLSYEPKMEEKLEVSKILVPKINLLDIKKSSPSVIMTPTGRGRLQKELSARSNCLCSPTKHAGSFRCRRHRTSGLSHSGGSVGSNLSELAAKSAASIGDSPRA